MHFPQNTSSRSVVMATGAATVCETEVALIPNGSQDAVGAYVLYFGEGDKRNVAVGPLLPPALPTSQKRTNNRMHILALLHAGKIVQQKCTKVLRIMTRSEYTVNQVAAIQT